MPLEVFGYIEGIEELAVEAREHHLNHDDDIQFVIVCIVLVRIFLVFDALLHITVVLVEEFYREISTKLRIVLADDFAERTFVFIRMLLVVRLLLW